MKVIAYDRPLPPPARHINEKFENKVIDLDNQSFTTCNFEGCTLVYNGGPPPSLDRCSFKATNFMFAGGAANTIQFMAGLYSGAGEGGKQLIEGTFENIRSGKLSLPEVQRG